MSDIPELPPLESDPELAPLSSGAAHAIFSAQRPRFTRPQMIMIGVGVFVVLILAIVGVRAMSSGGSPTPSPSVVPTATPMENEELLISPSPTATPSPSPLATKSPTPKPTVSPTPTPTATPSPTPSPTPQSKILTKGAGQDGYITDTGYAGVDQEIQVGRTPLYIYRGLVGFDLAEIPASAHITKATLRIYQKAVYGDPFTALGALQVDHLDYGTTITADSYNGGNVFAASFATIPSGQLAEWKTVDVTEQVKKDRSVHTSSQFRMHFATETKGGASTGDVVIFSNPSATGTNDLPQLIVEYN
ncbi:MAG: DNRLRE domain-containing protein [Candidatus Woesebacteria bacterium]